MEVRQSRVASNMSFPKLQKTPQTDTHEATTPSSSSVSHHCVTSLKTSASQISCLAVHNNTLYAATINGINVYDLSNHTLLETFSSKDPTSGLIKSIAFHQDKIFTAHQDCKIRVWQITSSKRHRLITTLPTVKNRLRRCMSPGNYVQVRRHKKRLWVEHHDAVSGLVCNNGFLYSASWDKSIKIWKVSGLRCMESVIAHEDAVNAVGVSPDGVVYTGSADGSIKVWERESVKRKHALRATMDKHRSAVNALALNGDGSVLFSGGCDRVILVWERKDSECSDMFVRWSLNGHNGAVLCLVYDYDMLFSGSSDCTVRIWQREGGGGGFGCLVVLEGHSRPVKSLAVVSDDGVTVCLCSGSLDCQIKIWHVTISSSQNYI